MLANALLWLFSIILALIVHALGLLLFEPHRPDLPSPNAFNDEIVVVLGQGSGGSIEAARPLKQPDSVTRLEIPEDAAVDPLAVAAPQAVIEEQRIEDEISAPLHEDTSEPDEAQQTSVASAEVPEQQLVASRIDTVETGETLPGLTAQDPEAADTVALATAPGPTPEQTQAETAAETPAQETEERRPVSVAATEHRTHVLASPPVAVDIARPGTETTSVVAPAQFADDTEVTDRSDLVKVEESPEAGLEEPLSPAEDAALEQVQVAGVSELETAPLSPADTGDPEVTPQVEEEITQNKLAAVVLEFETVEASSVSQAQDPDPQAATLVSIEEQIARALTLDETQTTGLGMGVVAKYAGLLKGRLEESMHYPRAARLAGQQGSVVVRFVIDRNGNVLSIVLEKPSGYAILDREAVEMIERAEPFPVMPGEMSGEVLELRVPIAYKIDDASQPRDIPPIYLD